MTLKRLPEVITLLLLLLFFYVRYPSNPWNRVIHSDGKGYYAHLPAIFIYNDLEYGFDDEVEKKYYPADGHLAKHYRFYFKGEIVNKTFSGITILWLPFFLIAHFLSYLLGFTTDGYSILYQFAIGLSAIFYFWIGCRILQKLLKEFLIPERMAWIVLIGVAFGTNFFYYLLLDPSLTHSYNFTLIAGFLLYIKRFSDHPTQRSLLLATTFFSLILCIRPQNGFIVFALPFIFGSIENTISFFRHLFGDLKRLLKSLLIFLAFIAVPISLWYLQTGYLLVYSYGEEGFDFSNPQFFNVLFSYQKGLFVYSPLVLVSMFGLVHLFRQNRFRFIALLAFFLINTYIISSWEEWWYGCSYGHRVFIDFYAIVAILLGMLYLSINGSNILKWTLHVLVISCIGLNLIQTYQHYTSIVPACFNNKTLYWQNFLKLVPDARAKIAEEDYQAATETFYDIEEQKEDWSGWENSSSLAKAYSGKVSSKLNKHCEYSITHRMSLDSHITHIKVSAMLYAKSSNAEPQLVIDLQSANGSSIDYNTHYLKPFMRKNKWFLVEFLQAVKPTTSSERNAVIYFWYPGAGEQEVFIDDISITPFYPKLKVEK